MSKMLLTLSLAAAIGLLACQDDELMAPMPQAPAIIPAQGSSGITVMTRNIYLGFDIDGVLAAGAISNEAMMMALVAGWQDLHATDFAQRAEALADEILATRPHLIGLQEVIKYRTQYPGDFIAGQYTPNATVNEFDFLQLLRNALEDRGLEYVVAAMNPTTDVEVPMPVVAVPTGSLADFMDVRYTDHDVILARSDVDLGDSSVGEFEDKLQFSLGGLPGYRPLGYAAVEATVSGRDLLFVSTHLETQDHPDIQVGQIDELIDWMSDQSLPIVLVGDLNSAANPSAPESKKTETYGMLLDAGFHDVWLRGHSNNEGLTCCHATDLVSANAFDQRLDLILVNQGADTLIGGVQTAIVGIKPFQASQPKWASDHAGLVATLRLPVGINK